MLKNQYNYYIRKAKKEDIKYLNSIEKSAGELFRTIEGYEIISEDDPIPNDVLKHYFEVGNLWVAIFHPQKDQYQDQPEEREEVVGFLAAFPIYLPTSFQLMKSTKEVEEDVMDGKAKRKQILLHIAELSVSSNHQRRGIAKMFLQNLNDHVVDNNEKVLTQGERSDYTIVGLSLTTYTHLSFNGGFYRAQGFEEVDIIEIVDGLKFGKQAATLWMEEQEKIKVGKDKRCWMVKWI